MKTIKFIKGIDQKLYEELLEKNKNNDLYPKLYEELNEFIEAHKRFRRDMTGDNHVSLIKEAVDVYLVSCQLGITTVDLEVFMSPKYFNHYVEFMGSEYFHHMVNYKISRTLLKLLHGDYPELKKEV